MSMHRILFAIGYPMIALCAAGLAAPQPLSGSARGQGFYFESWGGGYGVPQGGVSIGIGVPPSSPLFYGVRPGRIFPPLGFRGFYGVPGPAVPFAYRDDPLDYYNRLYQYREQLETPHRHGVDPMYQSSVRDYLRGWTFPPPGGVPPVVQIEPYADQDRAGLGPQQTQPMSTEEIGHWLRDSAQRLNVSLARRGEEGEIWRDYLAPDTIIQAIDEQRDPRELGQLLLNYDGVLTNGQLRWVMRSDGFADTRLWLRRYIEAAQAHEPEVQDPPTRRDPATPPPPPSPPPADALQDLPTQELPRQENAVDRPAAADPSRPGGVSL